VWVVGTQGNRRDSGRDNVPKATTTTISKQLLVIGSVLQSESGLNPSNLGYEPNFTVPSSAKGWIFEWSFGGRLQAGDYRGFMVEIQTVQGTTEDWGPWLPSASSGSGTDRYYGTGTFSLDITTHHHFSYMVRTLLAPP